MVAVPLAGHMLRLSGTASDSNPASVKIALTGAATGTAAANAAGAWSYTTCNATLGVEDAVATDGQGLSSPDVKAVVFVAAPSVTMAISYGAQKTVTLSGGVTDLDPGNRTVTFSGMVTGSAVTDAAGNFSYTAQASALGNVDASTVDLWSLQSNVAQVTVACLSPVVSNFGASEGPLQLWTFSGVVTAASPAGLVVTLGGFPSIAGKTATVQADGSWSVTAPMQASDNGEISAQTTDWWGQASNIDWTLVHQT
jgi:hypothetical protein